MARQSRDARSDAALVILLQALPAERLQGVLEALGVPVMTDEQTKALDPRRCRECGNGYVRCRTIAEKSGDDHDWIPDRSRSDV